MNLKNAIVVSGVFSAIILSGCTSTGPVEKVNSRAVDRSYTLPSGVASWSTLAILGNIKTPSDNTIIPPIPIPLFWEQSLNDNLTLVWGPLPLELKYQISKTDIQLWGVNFGIGGGYGSGTGWILQPRASVTNRSKLNSDLAIQSTFGGRFSFETGSRGSNGYSFSASSGALFQLSDIFALNAAIGVEISKANLGLVGVSGATTNMTSTIVPLTIGSDWRFARQWSFNTTYAYYGLGSSDWSANILLFDLTHYW